MTRYTTEKIAVASEILRVLGDNGRLQILGFIKDKE